MSAAFELSRVELAQTIITISTALVAARDIDAREAALRAVQIVREAFNAADVLIYEMEAPERR